MPDRAPLTDPCNCPPNPSGDHTEECRQNGAMSDRIMEWHAERERIQAALAKGTDADGWNLSPEAMDNLRADLKEVTRTINRLSGELANPVEFATGYSYASEPLSGQGDTPKFAPVGMDEKGEVRVCCEACGSRNLDFDGHDIDKCKDCGHWRYR